MNRCVSSVACLMTLALAATAWAQSSSLTTSGTLASSGTSAVTGTSSTATDGHLGIKKLLRNELSQVAVDLIQELFRDLRTSLGLSTTSTDSATDPIAILESAVTDMVTTILTQ